MTSTCSNDPLLQRIQDDIGTDPVLMGRAVLYRAAVSGEAGAARAVFILLEEINRPP